MNGNTQGLLSVVRHSVQLPTVVSEVCVSKVVADSVTHEVAAADSEMTVSKELYVMKNFVKSHLYTSDKFHHNIPSCRYHNLVLLNTTALVHLHQYNCCMILQSNGMGSGMVYCPLSDTLYMMMIQRMEEKLLNILL